MHVLKDFVWELGEVEEDFDSNEYDVQGHFFCGVMMRCLKSNVFGKIEIYKFEETSKKSNEITNIVAH